MSARLLDDLAAWSEGVGQPIDGSLRRSLQIYLDTLLLWSSRLSLVSQKDPKAVCDKHLADSLFAARCCRHGDRVVDLGSGAGFPGLVIAMARPDVRVCLMESRAKRCSFLQEAARLAGVGNAGVFHGRIEDAARLPEHHRAYTLALSRALADVDGFLRLARPLLGAGGRAVAMKSAVPQTRIESPALAREFAFAQVVPYQLPDGSRRTLVEFHVKR
jgi:16S rRNA (guanine527-N7)-methyltransferase